MMNSFYIFQRSFTSFVYIFTIGLYIITKWKVFEKAGIEGWKSLIPFYSYYTLVTKVARKPRIYFWGPILCSFAVLCLSAVIVLIIFVSAMGGRHSSYDRITGSIILISIPYFTIIIFLLVMTIKLSIAIAKNFGEDAGFGVGLVLLYIPFYFILAFGDYKFNPVDQKSKGKKLRNLSKKSQDKDQYEEVIYVEDGEEIVEEDGYEYIYEDEEDEN